MSKTDTAKDVLLACGMVFTWLSAFLYWIDVSNAGGSVAKVFAFGLCGCISLTMTALFIIDSDLRSKVKKLEIRLGVRPSDD